MDAVIYTLLDLARMAGYVILAVLVLRWLFQKAPKRYLLYLWVLVAVRLLCPFSVPSPVSLVPAQNIPSVFTADPSLPAGTTPIAPLPDTAGGNLSAGLAVEPISVFAAVWLAGCIVLLLYGLVSCIRLRRRVAFAVLLEKGVYVCDGLRTPFVFGLFRPQIYLPAGLEPADLPYVLAHERAHIRYGDPAFRLLAYLLLCVYWFHPLVWLAFFLFCRDTEFACDERVLLRLGAQAKKSYSMALLHCAAGRRRLYVYPLAFGETGVKARIKGILHYKKPPFWIAVITLVAAAVTAVCLLTVPRAPADSDDAPRTGFRNARYYTEDGEQNLSVQWYQETQANMTFGEPFELYRYQGNQLQALAPLEGTVFNDIGYQFAEQGGTTEHVYHLSAVYGQLPAGIYRLTADYSVDGERRTAWADFSVDLPAYAVTAVAYVDPLSSYMPNFPGFSCVVGGGRSLLRRWYAVRRGGGAALCNKSPICPAKIHGGNAGRYL